jgi:integrase
MAKGSNRRAHADRGHIGWVCGGGRCPAPDDGDAREEAPARDTWGQEVQKIRWENHLLPEPKERVRELSGDEEAKLIGSVRGDYLPLFQFALWTGMRMSECLRLTWADIDWGNRLIRVHGKGGKVATIPLEPDVRDLLFPLQGRHETAVFCYRVARTGNGRVRGQWLPITKHGLKTRWRRDREASGVKDYRWHDNRHTAATRLLRASGNLRLAQKLLRHSDLTTTAKYAHVTDNDLRQALNIVAESRKMSRTKAEDSEQVIEEKRTILE